MRYRIDQDRFWEFVVGQARLVERLPVEAAEAAADGYGDGLGDSEREAVWLAAGVATFVGQAIAEGPERFEGQEGRSIRDINNAYRHGTQVVYEDTSPEEIPWRAANPAEAQGMLVAAAEVDELARRETVSVLIEGPDEEGHARFASMPRSAEVNESLVVSMRHLSVLLWRIVTSFIVAELQGGLSSARWRRSRGKSSTHASALTRKAAADAPSSLGENVGRLCLADRLFLLHYPDIEVRRNASVCRARHLVQESRSIEGEQDITAPALAVRERVEASVGRPLSSARVRAAHQLNVARKCGRVPTSVSYLKLSLH